MPDQTVILSKAVTIAVAIVITVLLLVGAKHIYTNIKVKKIHHIFFYNVVRLFIFLLAIGTIGSQFSGFSSAATTILASSGIVALGISLAAQSSLSNIIDGLFISICKPFNVGDRVTLPEKNNLTGFVSEITLRHTVITTYQHSSYIIPNSVMGSAIIDNSNFHNEIYSYPVDVSVSYESDLDKAMELVAEAISTTDGFVDTRSAQQIADGVPAVQVFVRGFGDSGIDLRCHMVTESVSASFIACSNARIKIKKLFDANGIVIPYTTIHLDH